MLQESLLSTLRCPDCLGEAVRAEGADRFRCEACGRVLAVRDGILCARPQALEATARVNLDFYDKMAVAGRAHLDTRSLSRNHQTKWQTLDRALQLGNRDQPHTVLELGTGAGAHAAQVVDLGHTYVGLDISAHYLRRSTRTYPALAAATLVEADATRIPFKDNVFERVFCVSSLHHLSEPMNGVRELVRVLAQGGRFCFLEPRCWHPGHLIGYLRNPRVERGTFKAGAAHMIRALAEAGVAEVQVSWCVFTPNGPAVLRPLYDWIDAVCSRMAPLRGFAVMACVSGQK